MIAAVDHAKEMKQKVEHYIAGVLDGSIVSGRRVKLAVKRHVEDLKHAHERGWYFDEGVATRACLFFPQVLRHSIGEYAGEPFDLAPWQAFCTWTLFGWLNAQTKLRRFLRAYLSVARKNGKTTWAAGLGIKSLYFEEPDEPAAQVYCAATKEDQAKILFHEARRMVEQCSWLKQVSSIRKSPNVISYSEGFFKPLGSDSTGTDGLNPSCVLLDELHAWREFHRPLREKLSTGGGARRQPLEIVITTAGDADSQLWIETDEYAERCVEAVDQGQVFDDRLFAYVCSIDKEDSPFDESCWPKANPNLGVSVKLDYLRAAAVEAKNSPTKTNQFVRYHCNQRTEATERTFSPDSWAAGAQPLQVADGAYGHGGIDIGRTNDWAAVGLCFPTLGKDGRATKWQLKAKAWTCSDGGFEVTHEPFASWIKAGLLECCKGNAVDSEPIEQWIVEQARKYHIKSWAFDKTYARDLCQRLQDVHGLEMFEFTQAPRYYNEPFRRFVTEMPTGKIIHGNDPVLNWQAANVQTARNYRDEWMPDKKNPRKKIDAMVAILMAFSECLFAEKDARGSLIVV